MSNEKQRQQHEEQDMNKKMAKSKGQGLYTKQVDQPDNECGGTGTVSTGRPSGV
jgi:hypothetical protein